MVLMALERIWMPEPHVLEQVPQVPCRVVVQSTGQAVLAQLRVTLRGGQAMPPLSVSVMTGRLLVC